MIALVVLVAVGVYLSLLRQSPLLSLLLGVAVGGVIFVIQARSSDRRNDREKP